MKYNKVFVLAFAAIILAVVASGSAFAASPYDGTFETTYSGSYPSVNGYSSGSRDVTSGSDLLTWFNTMHNNVGRSVTVYNDAFATNRFGQYADVLYNTENTFGMSQNSVTSNTFQTLVDDWSNSYTIQATHSYRDGSYSYTSPVNSQMTFY
ncbi:hypothetical protein [Methanocella arvoryzae]|uniref:Uncharacterized protein n=1 Tax=Methanocella arvoryzae (strain DSM 22066 / NBRC 105507 / MRE50) TaxID=351160 RepID=Q0W620_METAR|nr:hypothetical protein [Methanocella arvoryzae]CAJ36173.1 hypothetical protein RCIA40 [Methanocella arvoryzae MRE50]